LSDGESGLPEARWVVTLALGRINDVTKMLASMIVAEAVSGKSGVKSCKARIDGGLVCGAFRPSDVCAGSVCEISVDHYRRERDNKASGFSRDTSRTPRYSMEARS